MDGQQPSPLRQRCYACFRPLRSCLCGLVTRVSNRAPIVILQHPREHRHPFGTVRLLCLALANLRVERLHHGLAWDLQSTLPVGTSLLFPHEQAQPLDGLPLAQRPSGLLLLDGTWSHARAIYRANPWLTKLPHVCLPRHLRSHFRIRREPWPQALSTLEAVYHALCLLEPDTPALHRMLEPFLQLNEDQAGFPTSAQATPYKKRRRRQRPSRAVPASLVDADRLILVYAEFACMRCDQLAEPDPIYFTALRAGTGEAFSCFVRSRSEPSPGRLARSEVLAQAVAAGIDLPALRQRWQAFVGADSVVAAWTDRMVCHCARVVGFNGPRVALKAGYANWRRGAPGALEQVLEREGWVARATPFVGRAGWRQGAAWTVARQLGEIGAALETVRPWPEPAHASGRQRPWPSGTDEPFVADGAPTRTRIVADTNKARRQGGGRQEQGEE